MRCLACRGPRHRAAVAAAPEAIAIVATVYRGRRSMFQPLRGGLARWRASSSSRNARRSLTRSAISSSGAIVIRRVSRACAASSSSRVNAPDAISVHFEGAAARAALARTASSKLPSKRPAIAELGCGESDLSTPSIFRIAAEPTLICPSSGGVRLPSRARNFLIADGDSNGGRSTHREAQGTDSEAESALGSMIMARARSLEPLGRSRCVSAHAIAQKLVRLVVDDGPAELWLQSARGLVLRRAEQARDKGQVVLDPIPHVDKADRGAR